MVSHDMMLTCHMHEGLPLELNPVLKLLEMHKGCWWAMCTTCVVSLSNEHMSRCDPFSTTMMMTTIMHKYKCARAVCTTCLVSLSLSLSLLPSGLAGQQATWDRLCGRGHGITCPRGFFASQQGGGNSSATAIPTTTTCS